MFDFTPTTYLVKTCRLSKPGDGTPFTHFLQRFKDMNAGDFSGEPMLPKHCAKNIWIVKPSGLNQGRGIQVAWRCVVAVCVSCWCVCWCVLCVPSVVCCCVCFVVQGVMVVLCGALSCWVAHCYVVLCGVRCTALFVLLIPVCVLCRCTYACT